MIVTRFLSGQGLGNQLWVYASCRGIAEKLGYGFAIAGENEFKGNGFLNIDWSSCGRASLSFSKCDDYEYSLFRERLYYDRALNHYASGYDDRVAFLKRNTELSGLFQSERYLSPIDGRLSEWIRLSDSMRKKSEAYADVCILNIRGGEYKRHKQLILPRKYWIDGMEIMKKKTGIDQFLIVTDDHAYAKILFPGVSVLKGGVEDCYAALHGAHSVIVSNSSFSYFPIKTRTDKPLVIAPFMWSRFANKYRRWASPCNLYADWLWMDEFGELHSYEECLTVANATETYYDTEYNVMVSDVISQSADIGYFFPSALKNPLKRILKIIMPQYY